MLRSIRRYDIVGSRTLRDLYKDEVRDLARTLEIKVAERQPFPGPGLAIRCLGELTKERVHAVREACDS